MIDIVKGSNSKPLVDTKTDSKRTTVVPFTFPNQSEERCPYSSRARNGVIEYNGVTFQCDYKHNAITLGDVTSDPRKVLNINLPSGGRLCVNVDNLDELARAAGMFSPEDLNAIMRAIQIYKKCTSKVDEIEEEENKAPEEIAAEKVEDARNAVAEKMRANNNKLSNELIKQSLGDSDEKKDFLY